MKVLNRQLGKVTILDVFGRMTNQNAFELSREFKSQIAGHPTEQFAMINLSGVSQLDAGVCQTILEEAKHFKKSALITPGKLSGVLQGVQNKIAGVPKIFQDMRAAVIYFQKELVVDNIIQPEKRKFHRLEAALPVAISTELDENHKTSYMLVTSNISLAGLHAQFLDAESEEFIRFHVTPQDLKLFRINIYLPADQVATFDGKIVVHDFKQHSVSFEFYGGKESSRAIIAQYIAQQGKHEKKQ